MGRERERGNVKGKAGMKRGKKGRSGMGGRQGESRERREFTPIQISKKRKVGVYGKIVRDL